MNDKFDEAEFAAWIASEAAAPPGLRLSATRGEQAEVWDSALLDEDVRLLATEYLELAYGSKKDTVQVKRLAEQPPLYGESVVDAAMVLLARYALYEAPRLQVPDILGALRWLVSAAHTCGVVTTPDGWPAPFNPEKGS